MIDELNLDEMQARCDAATEPPWIFQSENANTLNEVECCVLCSPSGYPDVLCRYWATGCTGKKDAAFIAHAREDLPAVIKELRALRAKVDELLRQPSGIGGELPSEDIPA